MANPREYALLWSQWVDYGCSRVGFGLLGNSSTLLVSESSDPGVDNPELLARNVLGGWIIFHF